MMMNTSLALFFFVLVMYLTIARLRKPLRPPFITLELASSEKHATNVLIQWKPNEVQRAMATVIIDIVVVLVYLVAGELLLFALQPENSPSGIVWTHGVMMIGVALIAASQGCFRQATRACGSPSRNRTEAPTTATGPAAFRPL